MLSVVMYVVIHSISTSNHNVRRFNAMHPRVVIHSISTSNHNVMVTGS